MTIRQSKPTKLTDTQLVLLTSASQRKDRCLTRPVSMSERDFARAMNALVKKGLVSPVEGGLFPAGSGRRADEAPGIALTPGGLAAIGCAEPLEDTRASTRTGRRKTSHFVTPPSVKLATSKDQPTKRAQIIAMLSREQGASLDDLIRATGWLPHTTRAALTGLRQKGFRIERTERDDTTSVYRVVTSAAQGQAA